MASWWKATVFVFLLLVMTATADFSSAIQGQIDHLIQAGIQCRKNPGLAVAIVKDGQVLLAKGYGVTDLDTQNPVTADTQFGLASLTKAFTASLMAHVLAGNSSLSVSTNIYKTLDPGFAFNNSLRTTYATLEDLLGHRTGVPRNNYLRLSNDLSRQNFPQKLKYLPSVGGFRDSFYYNDLLYGLAAYITERLGGRPWEDQMKDTIFRPLSMTRSTFVVDVDFTGNDAAMPYELERSQLVKASIDFIKHWGQNIGSGNIFSTANDMSRWLLLLLNDGKKASGERVLREGTVAAITKPSLAIPPSSNSVDYRRPTVPETFSGDVYALGLRLGFYRGLPTVHHSGSTFGYRSYLTLIPDENVGIFTGMSGSDTDEHFRIALHTYLADQALGLSPWVNSTTICTYPYPWKSNAPGKRNAAETAPLHERALPDVTKEDDISWLETSREIKSRRTRVVRAAALPLPNYVGVYNHGAYGNLQVTLDTDSNVLQIVYGIGQWRLLPTGANNFDGQWLKEAPTLDMDFVFRVRGQEVYAVEAPDFESSSVPIFYRHEEAAIIG